MNPNALDAGQQKSAEQELLRQKAHFESLFTNTNDAMVFYDLRHIISDINPRFTDMFGYTPGEVRGRDINVLVDPEDREDKSATFSILDGRTIEMEVVRYSKNGRPMHVLLKGGPVFVDGKIQGGFAIYSDISQRKIAEKELIRARDEARAASRAKSDFLANMSHEIRTPLNGVVSMMSLLEETSLTREQREYVDMAVMSSESLLGIINDILDFSRIEAGRLELTERTFDLEEEANRVMSTLSAQSKEKKIEFLICYDVKAPNWVRGDNLRLRQVLSNLAGNAVKFTEQGHVLLEVQCLARNDNTARFRIAVRDTGLGIPPDKQEDIFLHFTQADYSSTRKFGGAGLGLAISRHLVRMMGGELKVESREGHGSEFYFEIILTLAEEQAMEKTEKGLKGHRALIVDDNHVNRRILRDYLKNWGVEYAEAEDAYAALRLLEDNQGRRLKFSLAFIDHAMPGMDGLELAAEIRKISYWDDMILIALSSHWGNVSPKRFYHSGFSSLLPKPINRSDLLASVENCLNGMSEFIPAKQDFCLQSGFPVRNRPESSVSLKPGLRVLLVEDNPVNRKSALMMLENNVKEVTSADNGQEAVRLFNEQDFDLVLMDVQMPVMDGLEAARRIRAAEDRRRRTEDSSTGTENLKPGDEAAQFSARSQEPGTKSQRKRIPIIALTANAMAGDREECLQAGMDGYISKPVRKNELLEIIQKYFPGEHYPDQEKPEGNAQDDEQAVSLWKDESGQKVVFNLEEFMERYDQDLETAVEILQVYLDDVTEIAGNIRGAVQEQDREKADMNAHKLMGSSGYVGAEIIEGHCAVIMQAIRDNDWDLVRREASMLEKEARIFTREARSAFKLNDLEK
jgi:two-component system, sensor histidine kinase and response regulator